MINVFTFAFVASALSLAVVDGKSLIATEGNFLATREAPVHESTHSARAHLFAKRASSHSLVNTNTSASTPTPVTPLKTGGHVPKRRERLERRTGNRFLFKQIRVYGFLTECLNGILPHTQIIRNLCTGKINEDAEKLSWDLLAELRAILEVLRRCLMRVQDCGKAPTPSGAPGGKTPTLEDICQIFFKILCEIRECCQLIGSLCLKYRRVRQVCQDTLTQITGCLSNIAIRCGVEVGDVFTGLGRRLASRPGFFLDIQFGFSAIPRILGGNNDFFSFNAFF